MPAPQPTAAMVAEVRRMTAELEAPTPPVTATSPGYTDDLIRQYIAEYPLVDRLGQEPFFLRPGTPPTTEPNPNWMPVPGWDLHRAAAKIWGEKAAALACGYDFGGGDGQYFQRSQAYKQAQQQERYHLSRGRPRFIKVTSWTGKQEKLGYRANDPE